MERRVRRSAAILGAPLMLLMSFIACGQTPQAQKAPSEFQPKVEPLYEQCASLDASKLAGKQVEQSIVALKSADLKVRVEAADQLGTSCDGRAVEPLLSLIRQEKEIAVRAAAVRALGRLGAPESIDPLREMIADPAWQVRLEVGRSLCSFQVHRASYDVLNQLVNPNATTVSELGDLYARCQAILSINQLRDVNFSRKSVHFLFYFLDSPAGNDSAYRAMANATLHELKNTRNGSHELVGILKQNLNPVFRLKAVEWIGLLGIASGAEALSEAATDDRDPRVRDAAAKALAQLKQASARPAQ